MKDPYYRTTTPGKKYKEVMTGGKNRTFGIQVQSPQRERKLCGTRDVKKKSTRERAGRGRDIETGRGRELVAREKNLTTRKLQGRRGEGRSESS